MRLTAGNHGYGKTEIDFIAVSRTQGAPTLTEVSASVEFSGGFAQAYATGDNAPILPTKTMVNTVLALAPDYVDRAPEEFAAALADHFVAACPAVGTVTVRLAGQPWTQLAPGGVADHSGFTGGTVERWTVQAESSRAHRCHLTGGVEGLRLAKTTGSQFTGFLHGPFTNNVDVHDRVMGLLLDLQWHLAGNADDPKGVRGRVREVLDAEFSAHKSLSSQHTLHVLGSAVLAACPEVERVELNCQARDHILADLAPFGVANPDRIYLTPRNPYSFASLALARE